jgi:6,7-dimethyl-8-ribityllumazine synthase
MPRVLIIEARFYDHINDGLLAGAREVLDAKGVAYEVLTLPGILEIPAALKMVVTAAEQGNGKCRYDGYVTLGCAIRGESDHYDHVSTECYRGQNDLAMAYELALGSGVLTVHNEAQALNRSDPKRKNLGGQAARACLRMMQVKKDMGLA